MKENLTFFNNTPNHQNVPQDRLIENLMGILEQKFKEGQNAAGVDKPHSIAAEKFRLKFFTKPYGRCKDKIAIADRGVPLIKNNFYSTDIDFVK
jgi:hypothetical protein